MESPIGHLYQRYVLEKPHSIVIIMALLIGLLAFQAQHFKVDASGDSLVLENDGDLRYYQKVRELYGTDEYLVVTFQPNDPLFSENSLATLESLSKELEALDRVTEVNSILTAPLLAGMKNNLMRLLQGIPNLRKGTVPPGEARDELLASPIFRDLLVSEDGSTTALQIRFDKNEPFENVQQRRRELRQKKQDGDLSEAEVAELASVSDQYRKFHTEELEAQRQSVRDIREILAKYRNRGELYLGGVPMIVADMIAFVRSDIVVFGLGVLLFLIVTLGVIFRKIRWVLLPLLCCIAAVTAMLGFLGWIDWRATVISSNFTSLLLIITMSMAIHLVVRYREWHESKPELSVLDRVKLTVRDVGLPCFYCAMTTMVGFGSLVVSGIRPVIDFGWMMTIGIGVAFLLTFLIFPSILVLLPDGKAPNLGKKDQSLTGRFAAFTEKRGGLILLVAILGIVYGGWGLTRLKVENRFIDYFRQSTEIYQGMEVIDRKLGGTNPLEIVLMGEGKDYWFKPDNLARLRQIHEFLDGMKETGKVLSVDSLMRVAEGLNNGKPLNPILMASLRNFLPENLREQILKPYATKDFDQVRIVMRIRETGDDLQRQALLIEMQSFLESEMGMTPDQFRFTGMYVLYNNMLQSLFQSQIMTMGMVFIAILVMFLILFRSIRVAFIAIIPNIFPAIVVLGTMGWVGIPLDMMTITIAAITIGIAVDHTIHYVHRFKREFADCGNYLETMHRCHGSIGRAMYYTSLTIIVGFSILAMSNFIPTIYFGLFTGLAMVIALLAALTLLPRLLVQLKPLGPEKPVQNPGQDIGG